jgi:hypothetical protein
MRIEEQIDKILKIMGGRTGVHVQMLHDDNCPALRTHRMIDCTCTPEIRKKRMDA